MSRMTMFLSSTAVIALVVSLAGCAREQASPTQPAADQPQAGDQEAAGHDRHEHLETNHAHHMEDSGAQGQGQNTYEEALSQLSQADRALAEKQQVCPVSGEPLGSMGKPYKVTVKGEEVFLCCSGCEAEIKANPDKYLTKLNK